MLECCGPKSQPAGVGMVLQAVQSAQNLQQLQVHRSPVHPHFKPAEPYRFNISPEGLQNSGKCYTYDYSFIITKRYKVEPAKVREHSKDSGKFQIGNFLVLGDVSHSRHPCVTVLRVLPIQDASQSSSAKDLLGFHK